MSQHVALLLNLGVLKNCLLALGGGGNCPPLATALLCTGDLYEGAYTWSDTRVEEKVGLSAGGL